MDISVIVNPLSIFQELICINISGIGKFLRIWLHLLKKSLMVNFIFCAVTLSFDNSVLCSNAAFLIAARLSIKRYPSF